MNNTNATHGWVNVATFNGLRSAEALKSALQEEGIEAQVQNEKQLQRFWFASKQKGGIHVRVPAQSFEQAQKSLRAKAAASALEKAIHCPSCGSTRVEYPAMTRKNMLPTLMAHLLVAVGIAEHEYYCEHCHYMWTKAGNAEAMAHQA